MWVGRPGKGTGASEDAPHGRPKTGDHDDGHEKSRDTGGLSAFAPGFQTRIADVQRQQNHAPASGYSSSVDCP